MRVATELRIAAGFGPPRRILLAGAAAACVAAGALALASAPASAAGLLVSPTRIDEDVRRGEPLPPITLDNRTETTLRISAITAPARQELSGLPVFDLSARSVRAGRRLLRVSPARLRLGPGERARVSVIAGPPPRRGQVGVYAVVAFTAQEAGRAAEGDAVVAPTLRLTTNLLLRYPGKAHIAGRATALRAEQAPGRSLRFLARVRNDGDLHVRPRARLTVLEGGRAVLRRSFRPENVLPGAERELALDVAKRLPAGEYRARVDARVGSRRSVQRASFRLVGPNELPTPALRIAALPVPQPSAGQTFDATVALENAGTAAATAAGTLTVSSLAGERLLEEPLRIRSLAPGGRERLEIALPGLEKGRYRLDVRFASGPRVLDARSLVFETGTRPSLVARVQDWMAANIPLLVGMFGLVLALVVAALLAYVRRLRRAVQTGAHAPAREELLRTQIAGSGGHGDEVVEEAQRVPVGGDAVGRGHGDAGGVHAGEVESLAVEEPVQQAHPERR